MKRWFLLLGLIVSSAFLIMHMGTGCDLKESSSTKNIKKVKQEEPAQPATEESAQSESTAEREAEIEASDASDGLQLGFKPGEMVTNFKLQTIEGSEISLFELLESKPVLLEFGAYT